MRESSIQLLSAHKGISYKTQTASKFHVDFHWGGLQAESQGRTG